MLGQRLDALELLTVKSSRKSLQTIGKVFRRSEKEFHHIFLAICVRLSRESLRGVEKFIRADRRAQL